MRVYYVDSDIKEFIRSQESSVKAKIMHTVELLQQFTYELRAPHSKKVGDDLFELRIVGKVDVRLFYTFYQDDIYILHGFVKKTQKIPQRELQTAKRKRDRLQEL